MQEKEHEYEKPDKPISVPRKAPRKVNQEGGDTRWYT